MSIPIKMMMAAAGRGEVIAGNAYIWGEGSTGELGDGLKLDVSSPIQVGSLVKWGTSDYHMAAGNIIFMGIRQDGTLWVWGKNNYGSLGLNVQLGAYVMVAPTQIGTLTNWSKCMGGGGDCGGAIKTDGTLWTWGHGGQGRLGLGDNSYPSGYKISPNQVGSATNWVQSVYSAAAGFAINSAGQLWSWGHGGFGKLGNGSSSDTTAPGQVGSLTTWAFIGAGDDHLGAVRTDGTLWTWGLNDYGQLGDGTTTNRSSPVQVAGTTWSKFMGIEFASIALKTDGTLWSWGRGLAGQLGHGNTTNLSSPVQIGSLTDWKIPGFHAYYGNTVLVVKTDGTLWGWGENTNGLIGNGATTDLSSPVQIGSRTNWAHAHAGRVTQASHMIDNDGILYGTGAGQAEGNIGNGTISVTYSSPVQVGNHSPYISIAGGNAHTLAVTKDGKMWGWGNASPEGEVGDLTTVDKSFPVQIGAGITWAKVAAHDFSAAITDDGKLYTWGAGFNGGTGHGNTTDVSSPVQVGSLTDWGTLNVRSARFGSVKTDGTLWMCGNGGNGALANGSSTSVSSPIQVGSLTTWAQIGMGLQHCAGLTTAGTIFTWGANGSGQLGHGGTTAVSSPVQVGSLTDWADLSVGSSFTVAIKTDGTLWAWGDSGNGKLGNGDASTDYSSPIQIGSLTDWKTLMLLGSEGVRAIKTDGTLWAWGRGTVGQIGNGSANSISSPVQVGSRTDWLVGNVANLGSLGIRDND